MAFARVVLVVLCDKCISAAGFTFNSTPALVGSGGAPWAGLGTSRRMVLLSPVSVGVYSISTGCDAGTCVLTVGHPRVKSLCAPQGGLSPSDRSCTCMHRPS